MDNPAYIGIRQKDYYYVVSTMMEFKPMSEKESAGIAIVQSNEYHMRYEYIKKQGRDVLQIVECKNGEDILIDEIQIDSSRLYLKLVCNGQRLAFHYGH